MTWWRTLLGIPDPAQTHSGQWSVSDPALAEAFGAGWLSIGTGLPTVTEAKALAIPAYSRGEQIIAGTIAGLPLKTYTKDGGDGPRREVVSVLDNPQGPVPITQFAWVERAVTHLVRYDELYLKPINSAVGDVLLGIEIVHPGSVIKVEADGWGKAYTVRGSSGDVVLRDWTDPPQIVQVLGPGANTGQLRGAPIYQTSAPTFQIGIAALGAMGRVFTGPMIRGLVTPADKEEDISPVDMELILTHMNARIGGTQNAGQLAAVNRRLKIDPWEQTNEQAKYAETLTAVTEAFARLLGLPPHLLAAIDKQTSWGTGIAEQNIGLSRYCLMSYTSRIEPALARFLPAGQFDEFDYKGLLQGSPQQEAEVLVLYKGADIIDKNEARAVLNLAPQAPAAAEGVPADG